VSAQNNGDLVIWDAQLTSTLHSIKDAEFDQGLDVLDSSRLAVGCGKEVRIWDILTGKRLMDMAKTKQTASFTCLHSGSGTAPVSAVKRSNY